MKNYHHYPRPKRSFTFGTQKRHRGWQVAEVKSNSADDGANSARNTDRGAAAEVDRGEEWMSRWMRMTRRRRRAGGMGRWAVWGGCKPPGERETGRGRNFARARLHPPRPPPPPPLDAEGSWTARVRCQFCARSPPLKVFVFLLQRALRQVDTR